MHACEGRMKVCQCRHGHYVGGPRLCVSYKLQHSRMPDIIQTELQIKMSEKYTVIWECVLLCIYVYSWVRVHMRVIRAEGNNWSSNWAIGSVCVCCVVTGVNHVVLMCLFVSEYPHACVHVWVRMYVCVHTVSMCTCSYVLHICLWMHVVVIVACTTCTCYCVCIAFIYVCICVGKQAMS